MRVFAFCCSVVGLFCLVIFISLGIGLFLLCVCVVVVLCGFGVFVAFVKSMELSKTVLLVVKNILCLVASLE